MLVVHSECVGSSVYGKFRSFHSFCQEDKLDICVCVCNELLSTLFNREVECFYILHGVFIYLMLMRSFYQKSVFLLCTILITKCTLLFYRKNIELVPYFLSTSSVLD